jgi:hypothetical protein
MTAPNQKSQTGGKFALIFGIVWLVVALPFTFAGIYMLKMEDRYEKEGVEVTGAVTSKHIDEKRDYDRDTKRERVSKSYHVKYKFDVLGGETLESDDTISSDIWQNLNTDDPIQIQYLKGEPDKNRIAHSPEKLPGYLFFAFGALADLIGFGSIAYYIKRKRFINELMQNGMLIDGVITKVFASSLTINDVRQWQFEYSYKDLKGGQHTGKSSYLSPEEASHYKAGAKGRVRYDQNKPKKSIWVNA